MTLGFMICPGMYMSGSWTGMKKTITGTLQKIILQGEFRGQTKYSAAAPGIFSLILRGQQAGTGIWQGLVLFVWGSG
jgi:hypothetical protein